MRVRLMLLLLLTFIGSSFAQDYEYIQYTSKDGLPTNYVYGVIEDDDGYIWAYTENGMSKFDGYSFKNFSTKDGLPGNDVVFCLKDRSGKIWLYTYRDKPAYLFQDSFHIVYDQPCIPCYFDTENIYYSCLDFRYLSCQDNKIEFFTLALIDSLILSKEGASLQLDSVRVLPPDWNENNLLIHQSPNVHITKDSAFYYSHRKPVFGTKTKEGYLYYFRNSGMIYWKNNNQNKSFYVGDIGFVNNPSAHLYKLRKKESYLMNIGGFRLILIDIKEETAKHIRLENQVASPQKNIRIAIMDSTILVEIDQGFLEYDFDGNCTDKMILNGLSENYRLGRPYKDAKGNVWIGSREGGLFLIPKQYRKTSLLTAAYAKDKAFEHLISTGDGKLLGITDNSGIYHIQNDSIANILPPNKDDLFRSATQTPYGIIMSSSRGGHVIKSNAKGFTINSFKNEFEILNTGEFKEAEIAYVSKLNNRLSLAYNLEENTLYTIIGSFMIDYYFLSANSSKVSVFKSAMSTLHYDTLQKVIYGGNSNGIFRIEGDAIEPFLQEYEELINISALYSTANQFWIGTESNGLFVYSFSKKELSKISDASMIRRIRADTKSNLLIASNEGVLLINPFKTDDPKINKYTIHDGLPTNEIQDVHAEGDRFIYVATTEGVHKLDRTVKDKTIISEKDLNITGVHVNNKKVKLDQLLDFSHLENTLNVQFNLLSYASNAKIQYYTKLTPFQTEWNKNDSRSVNYLSLPPNNYTFHLKAEDIYGNTVQHPELKIKIKHAWWQTTWFKLLVGLLTLGLIIGIVRYRDQISRKKLEKEKEINRRMAELELSALKAQMNPHFVFNALGAIQYFIQTNEVEAADNYLARFARLMRKYLDSSKEKMIPLNEELELITIYTDLEMLRFEDLFEVEINVEKEIHPDNVFLPSMIIQPFIENAINHGLNERSDKQGLLQINFTEQNGLLLCTIADNGIGRGNAKKNKWEGHQSRGLSIIEEKIHTLKSSGIADISINISDLDPSQTTYPGTQVTLIINNLEDEQI